MVDTPGRRIQRALLDRLSDALHLDSVNDQPIKAALITRFRAMNGSLDAVPRLRSDGVAAVPDSWRAQTRPPVPQSELAEWVSKRVWDSEGLDDHSLLMVEHLVAYQTLTPAVVADITGAGARGTLLSATIAACCGFVDQNISAPLILKEEPFPGRHGAQAAEQLLSGWTLYLAIIAADERARTAYLSAIDGVLHNPEYDRTLLLAALHELDARPSPQQMSVVLREWPSAQSANDGLVISAAMLILEDANTSDGERRQIQDAMRAALNQFAAHGKHWGRSGVLRQLGLPLLYWMFGGSADDGVALEVFAQGFVSTLKTGDASQVEDAFEAIAPLVARLEPENLASALRARAPNRSPLAQSVGWLVQALVQAAPRHCSIEDG